MLLSNQLINKIKMENFLLNKPQKINQLIPIHKVPIPIIIQENLVDTNLVTSSKSSDNNSTKLFPNSSKVKNLKNISENTLTVRPSSNNLNSVFYRKDAFGVPIVKGSKDHKVSFYDILTRKKLTNEIYIDVVRLDDKRRNNDAVCQCSCILI